MSPRVNLSDIDIARDDWHHLIIGSHRNILVRVSTGWHRPRAPALSRIRGKCHQWCHVCVVTLSLDGGCHLQGTQLFRLKCCDKKLSLFLSDLTRNSRFLLSILCSIDENRCIIFTISYKAINPLKGQNPAWHVMWKIIREPEPIMNYVTIREAANELIRQTNSLI